MSYKSSVAALLLALSCFTVSAQNTAQPFPKFPGNGQAALAGRLTEYLKAYRNKNWAALYSLVSDTGKGGVNRRAFVAAMSAKHGRTGFGGMPDLLEFLPDRSDENADGTDIYGCAKATREGEAYTGIAVVHAVHEHATWTFTGWSFTEFPNLSCKLLADPSWKPAGRMGWDQPMEEVRNVNAPSKAGGPGPGNLSQPTMRVPRVPRSWGPGMEASTGTGAATNYSVSVSIADTQSATFPSP